MTRFPHRMAKLWVCLGIWALTACRCDENVGSIETGFLVEESALDFGRVPELLNKTLNVTVVSTTRASVLVDVSATAPFSAPSRIEIAGGGRVLLPVTFTASNTVVEGLLTLKANDLEVKIALRGEGVRPLPCMSNVPCVESRYEFETHRCVETVLADNSPCTPASLCQENGRCFAGECNGEQRLCDDQNVCTRDACSETVGCVNSSIACPMPQNPCKVPLCHPIEGCKEVNAVEGTPCGAADCVTSQVCVVGTCQPVPTADGTVCAPRTPCQDEGVCQNKVCVLPPIGVLQPEQVIPFTEGLANASRLLAQNGAVFLTTCTEDAGCRLSSFTASGLERFVTELPAGVTPSLVNLSSTGVLIRTQTLLASYSPFDGVKSWETSLSELGGPLMDPRCQDDGMALLPTGQVVVAVEGEAPDSGVPTQRLVWLDEDGGVQWELTREEDGPSLLAVDTQGRVHTLSSSGTWGRAFIDGGVAQWEALASFSGASSLLMNQQTAWVGNQQWVPLFGDGGASVVANVDAGLTPLNGGPRLMGRALAYGFFEACESLMMSCAASEKELWLLALSTETGNTAWQAPVHAANEQGGVVEAALMSGEAVYAVTQATVDGGPQAFLQAFLAGKPVFACPFPEGQMPLGAVFEGNNVHAFVQYDGGFALESFELGNVSTVTTDWPQRRGVSGARRAR